MWGIECKDVVKNYYQYKVFSQGKLLTRALKGVSFRVRRGDFFGVVGQNGAGKSTLMKILTTNLKLSSGNVLINGYDVDKELATVKDHISWMFGIDYDGVGWSSVEKNMMLAAHYLGLNRGQAVRRVHELLLAFDLYRHRKLDVWRLSTGMSGKFSLAVAMLKKPAILFLDEPLLGLDVEARDTLRETLRQLNRQGTTIVYTDQQLNEMEKVCKSCIIINKGVKMYDGSVEDLKRHYRDTQVVDMEVNGGGITGFAGKLRAAFPFVREVEIVASENGVHSLRIFTNVDNSIALSQLVGFFWKHRFAVLKANAGVLDLEDVFRKFLRRRSNHPLATLMHHYAITKEEPPRRQMKLLRHHAPEVRAAACKAFHRQQRHRVMVEKMLGNMLAMAHHAKVEALKVMGDLAMRHDVRTLKQLLKSRDVSVKLHAALCLGKIGQLEAVGTLRELMLHADTVEEVLLNLPRFDERALQALRNHVEGMSRTEMAFLLYHIQKMANAEALKRLLGISPMVMVGRRRMMRQS